MTEHEREAFEQQFREQAWGMDVQESVALEIWKAACNWKAARTHGVEAVYQLRSEIGCGWDDVTKNEYECAHESYERRILYTHQPKAQGVPEGFALIPDSITLSYEDIEAIITMTAWNEGRDDFGEVVLWVGTIKDDDGNETHGLNISCIEVMEECALPVHEFEKLTTPQSDNPKGEWKPAHGTSDELPEIGRPVMGYHRSWVDEDFCKDGIRECFLFGDGSEWQSARWDGYSDQWIVEDGAPELWCPHPAAPDMGGSQ